MNSKIPIQYDSVVLKEVCERFYLKKLAFFGSVVRDDFKSSSDIDVLVEFKEGHTPGFIKLYELEMSLSSLFGGRKVDIVTYKALNRHLKTKVLKEAEVQYAEG